MKNTAKILYLLVGFIAAVCGIIDLLFTLNLMPKISFEDDEKPPQQPQQPIVVVIEHNQTSEEKPPQENVTVPAPSNHVENDSAQTPVQNVSPQNVPTEEKVSVDGVEFLGLIDFYDKQIAELAADVNDHLTRNANYRNAAQLLERTERLTNDIRETEDILLKTKFKNEVWKNQLIKVIAAEFTRADGIREGVQSSYNGGSWKSGFERGHNGKIQFDKENGVLMNMYVKLVNKNSLR